jgi:hypothetical protein
LAIFLLFWCKLIILRKATDCRGFPAGRPSATMERGSETEIQDNFKGVFYAFVQKFTPP